jgi:hypothetical protein
MAKQQLKINNPAIREVVGSLHEGRQRYELLEDLDVKLPVNGDGGGIRVQVPSGYVTDFASVPRFFWRVCPPSGKYNRAAIVHDYLYTNSTVCSRFLADSLFRELMCHLGVPLWKRVAMYYAVRMGGQRGWKR